MDTLPSAHGHGAPAVLQRFLLDRPPERRALYWRDVRAEKGGAPAVTPGDDGSLEVAPGGVLGFDTYFNVFFEAPWLRHTRLRRVTLELVLGGPALLRVHRHALGDAAVVVDEVVGPGTVRIPIPHAALNFRQHGLLSLQLRALEGGFSLKGGTWLNEDVSPADTALAAVFCTFNRDAEIARVLHSVGDDPAVLNGLARIFVVNQGRPGIASRPVFAQAAATLGSRLTVIEQPNFGGAGGFSRGLLAALADPALTHAVLLDDDLALEPDSLLRMAAFFSFCDRDLVLGGHMLDMLHPTRMYEAGAVISDRHWEFLPQHHFRDVGQAEALEPLSHPYAVHYAGWWCCGFPLTVLQGHGMPLPCFIRGDDLEFGLRLHGRGVPTVPMPGIAVWHEPFYLKLGGWQLYYETRNILIASALHQPFDTRGVVRRMTRQFVNHLLTFRYYSAALILAGIRDFLAGPSVLAEPPLPRHAALATLRTRYPPTSIPRERVLAAADPAPIPGGRLRCLLRLGWLVIRNATAPAGTGPARIMPAQTIHWLTIGRCGHVAAETWWDAELPAYKRCRTSHKTLLREAAFLFPRLARDASRTAKAWRVAAPDLTSIPFWTRYLGLAPPARPAVEARVVRHVAADPRD